MQALRLIRRSRTPSVNGQQRRGAATVEFAIIVPVFGIFLAAMLEFGHAYMVQTMLRGAAQKAARYGVANGVSTAEVSQEAIRIVSQGLSTNALTVLIKDANIFDTSADPTKDLQIDQLPTIELSSANTRQLYIVRLELPYEEVALFPPFWMKDIVLHSQSAMRHE